jgi:plastocyanin
MVRMFAAVLLALFAATSVAQAGGSAVKGTVSFKGKAPERKEVNMKSDPYCAKQPAAQDEEVVVGKGGGLKNVVVRLAKGVTGTFPAPATEVVMDQHACSYQPHVAVAQAGQVVTIKNSDQTLHNVHTFKGPTTLFNQAQVFGTPPIKKKAPSVGDVVKFKCDVHPWMTGYLLVTDNPFFAVTGDDGSFSLKDIPAGEYTVEAWHEKLGTKTAKLTVAAGKPAELKFEFAAK